MIVVLLPGMDGTGKLFRWFLEKLPPGVEAKVISYPSDVLLTYAQLAARVAANLPVAEPYIIVAESFSGPVAVLLSDMAGPNLQAIVLVASFLAPVRRPLAARMLGHLLAPALSRVRPPRWLLRSLMLDARSAPAVLPVLRQAIASVSPAVLAGRFRNAGETGVSAILATRPVRLIYICAANDRLLGKRGLGQVIEAAPQTEIISIPGPHLLLQCRPDAVIKALEQIGILPVHLLHT